MLIIPPNAVNDIQCKLFKATFMALNQEQPLFLVSVALLEESGKGSRKRGERAQGVDVRRAWFLTNPSA